MNDIYRIENLKKSYSIQNRHIEVLKGLSFTVKEGSITFILGPSGAGKSTLLHIMGTLDKPTSGEVIYNEQNIFNQPDSKKSKWRNEKIGFVFQFHYLLNDFNALENAAMPYMINTFNMNEAMKRSELLLDKLGLGSRTMHKPSELSGGEQQRVAVARALVNGPEVILADEPTGNLDSANTEFVMNFIKNINEEEKRTFVIITHNEELTRYAQHIIRINDGNI